MSNRRYFLGENLRRNVKAATKSINDGMSTNNFLSEITG